MDRRQVLAGIAAIPALSLLPGYKRGLEASPLFAPVAETTLGIRTHWVKPQPEAYLSPMVIARYYSGNPIPEPLRASPPAPPTTSLRPIEPTRAIVDTKHAEDIVLGLAKSDHLVFDAEPPSASPTFLRDVYYHLPILINRAANLIAARTRRGAGNMVFMHPSVIEYLNPYQMQAFVPSASPVKIGRWTNAGTINGCVAVYTSETADLDYVAVAYAKGDHDRPAFLMMVDGKPHIGILTQDDNYAGANDYVQKVAIRRG